MYKCKLCGKEFEKPNSMGGHMNIVHRHPELQFSKTNKPVTAKEKDPEKWKKIHKNAMKKREAWRNNIELTQIQEQFVLGGLLGDTSIQMGNTKSINARLVFRHSLKQYDYCIWKYEMIKNLVKTQPKIEKNGGYGEELVTFATMSMPCFTKIHNMVKRNNETTITPEFLDKIDKPLALAIWIMDDGTKMTGKDLLKISLGNRQKNEVEMLQNWMKNKWNIKTTINEEKREWTMGIYTQSESLKLKQLIEPYVIDSMKYKTLFTT